MIIKEMAVRYKGGECVKCGYNKCIGALEFHHVDRTQKDFNISHKGYTRSWEKVKEELDKCELVCANCHREIEYGFARIEVPIRYNKVTYCLVCNAETNNDKFCSRACKGKYSRKCVRPTKEELAQLIIQHTYITIGKMYGVSDRAVKKWVDVYGL